MKGITLPKPASIATMRFGDIKDASPPRAGEVTVRLAATSLNFHDLRVVTGGIPVADGRIPMSDAAGEIVAVGEGVSEFKVGDAVISLFLPEWIDGLSPDPVKSAMPGDTVDGYAAEYVTKPASYFTRVPRGLSMLEAATLPCAATTAWRAVIDQSEVKPGGSLLVLGTGGVSIFALQIAKAIGIRVIATSSSEEKLEQVRQLGADEVINYRAIPIWANEVMRLTDGLGVDGIIEVGGSDTIIQSVNAVRSQGVIVLIGALSGREAALPLSTIFSRQMKIKGQVVGSRRHQLDMIAGFEAMGIRPQISDTFDLKDLGAAFEFQEKGAHFGKIGVNI